MNTEKFNDICIISKNNLREILDGYFRYMALEQGGVDNWSCYGWAMSDFIEEEKASNFPDEEDLDMEMIVETELESYPTLDKIVDIITDSAIKTTIDRVKMAKYYSGGGISQ